MKYIESIYMFKLVLNIVRIINRHYASAHNNEAPAKIDTNQGYASAFTDMPEKAKDGVIIELKEKVKSQGEYSEKIIGTIEREYWIKMLIGGWLWVGKTRIQQFVGEECEDFVTIDDENDRNKNESADSDPSDESSSERKNDDHSGNNSECLSDNNKRENEEEYDDSDDDAECDASLYYPDRNPVSIDSFPGAGSSRKNELGKI